LVRTGDRPKELRALRTLVRENYGLPLYEEVERAKVRLSDTHATTIAMHKPGIQFVEELTRWDFEGLIGPDIRAVMACIDRALAAAGLPPAAIDSVLRTGGSSRVASYTRALTETFGADRLREMDAFTSVAAGLAIAAHDERVRDHLGLAGATSR
jgi:hypothetical chaperone protein